MAKSPTLPSRPVRSNWRPLAIAGVLLTFACAAASAQVSGGRETLNFNPDWKFIKADPAGAQTPNFDDASWKAISTPHTYNDEDTFDDWSLLGHVGEQNQWSGRTWYRKTFTAPESWRGRKVYIEFGAVRQIGEVYLNGQLLGVCKTGFTPFGFDLTPHLKIGERNVIAVMADNRFMKDPIGKRVDGPRNQKDLNVAPAASPSLQTMIHGLESGMPDEVEKLPADLIPWNNPHWHPAHGGIYRDVKLHVVDPLHISLPLYSFLQTEGPYVYAGDITGGSARVSVEVPVQNDRAAEAKVELRAEVYDAAGTSVLSLQHQGGTIAAGGKDSFKLSGFVARPRLWSPDSPHLYRVVCTVLVDRKVVDTTELPLGIRDIRWDVRSGVYINGRHVMLHGWGQKPTNEWPGLGAALPDWMHYYTLDLMKQAGGNFLRWGHCVAGEAQVEASDRLGIVVEMPGVDGEADTTGAAWKVRAQAFRDALIYYRNNPSIFIWEGGNQKVTREHVQELRGFFDTYDRYGGRAYAHRRADEVVGEYMDVTIGTEGGHEVPRLPVVEGEYNREESPRRVWDDFSPPNFGYVEAKQNPNNSYQLNAEQFASHEVQHYVRKLLKNPAEPGHAGGANWLFTDSTSGGRVACEVARASGEVDGARLPKEAYYVCAAMFRDDPQVHIIGHWTYPATVKRTVTDPATKKETVTEEPTRKDIFVASNAEEVELFVNGKSLGKGTRSDIFLFTFANVAFEPGEIKAVASIGGKVVATQTKHTVGAPVALKLTPITGPEGLLADGSDVALFDVEAVDANGERCPTIQQRVDFEMEGPAIWRGGYNSGKIKSVNNTYLDLESGINRVAIRSTRTAGKITVRARSEGLQPGTGTVESKPFAAENGASSHLPPLPVIAWAARGAPTKVAPKSTAPANTAAPAAASLGRFIAGFSYSGPSSAARIERDAKDGGKIYVDRDWTFNGLPDDLKGADWIAAVNSEALYNAVDLMEIAVKGGTVVSIAHDARLAPPSWLARQFQPTGSTLTVNGQPMKLFSRRLDRDGSLTLGTNTDDTSAKEANMYIVFVNGAKAP
jgi:beta-galactosidase